MRSLALPTASVRIAALLSCTLATACPADSPDPTAASASETTDTSTASSTTGTASSSTTTAGTTDASTGEPTTGPGGPGLDSCDVPQPCADTFFGCDSDACPNTNQSERVCIFTLLRDNNFSRFHPNDAGEDGPSTWVVLGDADRTVLSVQDPSFSEFPIRRCRLKPADHFQDCINNAAEVNHACSLVFADWVEDPAACTNLDTLTCPEAP